MKSTTERNTNTSSLKTYNEPFPTNPRQRAMGITQWQPTYANIIYMAMLERKLLAEAPNNSHYQYEWIRLHR